SLSPRPSCSSAPFLIIDRQKFGRVSFDIGDRDVISDRGRERLSPSPPSEPCVRFSRTRLSSRWFPHRDWLANTWIALMVNTTLCREKTLAICLLMTPLSSAANMRSLHSEASTHNRYRSFVSAPCLTLTGTTGATLCSRRGSHASTFLSPFPQHDFAFRAFRGSTRNGTMETLTPAALTYDAGLPTYLATSSCRSASNHVGCLFTAYHHAS